MAQSSVSFSIQFEECGKIKIGLDNVEKKIMPGSNTETNDDGSSIKSLNSTKDSEFLYAGMRRRIPSISTESLLTTDSFFDNDDLAERSSTPISQSINEVESIADLSFISCVSEISEMSINTSSSQETITNVVTTKKNELNNNDDAGFVEVRRKGRKQSISYEKANKERYGGWVEGDWRSAMSKPKEKPFSTNTYKSPTSSSTSTYLRNSSSHGDSNYSKSRIPSLTSRPTYCSPSGHRRPSISSFSSETSHTAKQHTLSSQPAKYSSHNPKPSMKMTITTDSTGNMMIHFSNQVSEELWSVTSVSDNTENIKVDKIPVAIHE